MRRGRKALVGSEPLPAERLQALQLLAGAAREGVSRAEVVPRLVPQDPDAPVQPPLNETSVALLELQPSHVVGEPSLRRPGVVLLELEELETVLGQFGARRWQGAKFSARASSFGWGLGPQDRRLVERRGPVLGRIKSRGEGGGRNPTAGPRFTAGCYLPGEGQVGGAPWRCRAVSYQSRL